MSDSKTTGRKRSYWTRRNVLDLIFFLGFVLSMINTFIPLLPVRAKLTIFVDHYEFDYVNDNPAFTLKVFVKVVNDSPRTANIYNWVLTLNYNKTFSILDQADSHGSSLLSPSSQTDFTFSRTLVGENNTRLHEPDLRSIVVTIYYEDDLGSQMATREYDFV